MWFVVAMNYLVVVSVIFVTSLTSTLDEDYFQSNSSGAKNVRKNLLNSIYLVFSYVVLNSLVTVASHRYIRAWIYSLYGIEVVDFTPGSAIENPS